MTQCIVFTNSDGGVSICTPTGELPLEQVLAKDCPKGSIVIDDSELPKSDFDAWELVDGKVVVNLDKKNAILLEKESATLAKESALAKLAKLGLTEDEVKALVG